MTHGQAHFREYSDAKKALINEYIEAKKALNALAPSTPLPERLRVVDAKQALIDAGGHDLYNFAVECYMFGYVDE